MPSLTSNESRRSSTTEDSSLRDSANKAGTKAREFVDTASEKLSTAADSISSQIQEKPVQSSLIALGVGLVLGFLVSR